MPRYFFHFVSRDDFIPDYDGVILDDLRIAHRHAMRLVSQTLPVLGDDDPRDWKIEIADERQFVLLTVIFPLRPTFSEGGLDRVLVQPALFGLGSPAGHAMLPLF
jgi:hypothetical protein